MPNIVKELVARIEERAKQTKSPPCKLYRSEAAAEAVAEEIAIQLAQHFSRDPAKAHPARYVVVYIPSRDRWAAGFDLTEVMGRRDNCGGYLGFAADKGFYTF
jgi:hypothetical protein